jgi:glycosyltransferase involved in cell wall biosynthesis
VSSLPLISIVIPTYEMKGQGVQFLIRCLDSIEKQTGISNNQIEIVISDQSKDDAIERAIERYPFRFALRYYRTKSKPGIAAHNLNTAINHAQGQYVKIVFQDDLLVQAHYLSSVLALLTEQLAQCLITGAVHTQDGVIFENPIVPIANPYFLFGYNTISSPSVLTIARHFALDHPFDESLKMLFDCVFYYELFASGAKVVFAPELQIANGIWKGQAQHGISFEQMTREVRYVHRRFPSARLTQILPAYQRDFEARHPHAPFAFSTNLDPTPWERFVEWCQSRL